MTATTPRARLRLGIFGAGSLAQKAHLPVAKAHPDLDVVALCDNNLSRAEMVAQEFQVPQVFSNWEEMVKQVPLDMAIVCTPNIFHAPISIAALEAGAHVLCEKPMAIRSEDAERMAATAKRTGRILTIGHHLRFEPAIQAVKTLIDQGKMGRIYYIQARYLRRSGIPGFGSWFTRRELAGAGALFDIGVHALDLALYLLDFPQPETVSGVSYAELGSRGRGLGGWGADIFKTSKDFDVDELSAGLVRLAGGAAIQLEASWAGYNPSSEFIGIFGTEMGAEIVREGGPFKLRLHQDLNDMPAVTEPVLPQLQAPVPQKQYWWEIDQLVRAIRENGQPMVLPEESVITTRILEGLIRSAGSQAEVRFGKNK
ncbi:MAG: Gfo/Idh/MocA family oxidoreductase [Chloroflexi bacterium]|nr:Gfo/Idh/MocA family oxidoreductase [Chloroflexota bacterium]